MAWEDWTKTVVEKAREHTVLAIFGLIVLLLLIIWQAVPASVWGTVSEATPKRVLWALLGLESIAICLLAGSLITHKRKSRRTSQDGAMRKRFGILWDDKLNPHCPADQTLMRPRVHASNRDYDILMCSKCDHTYPLRREDMSSLLLPDAQALIRAGDTGEPVLLKQFGLLWDHDQNPHCPADKTLMTFRLRMQASKTAGEHDYLVCPRCKIELPIFDSNLGHMTLHGARNSIAERIRRGILK